MIFWTFQVHTVHLLVKLLNSDSKAVRKLAARLLLEFLHVSDANQSRFCELHDFSPVPGNITLNHKLPVNIKAQIIP